MARSRLTRKEIKQPDQFISFTVQGVDWVKTHTRYLLFGGIALLVIIGLLIGWSAWRRHRLQQAEQQLYQALKVLQVDVAGSEARQPDPAQREQARSLLQSLQQDYAGTHAAAVGSWHLGHLYFEAGDYREALRAYEQAQEGLNEDASMLPALVALNIGYTHEALGACESAVEQYGRVTQSPAAWLHGEARLSMGRCYEHSGATDRALATYEQALNDVSLDGSTRQQIEERLAQLRARINPSATAPASPSAETSSATPAAPDPSTGETTTPPSTPPAPQ